MVEKSNIYEEVVERLNHPQTMKVNNFVIVVVDEELNNSAVLVCE
jgi:hypothetical protein